MGALRRQYHGAHGGHSDALDAERPPATGSLATSSLVTVLLVLALGLLAGCGTGIKPYERAEFGRYRLNAERDPIESAMRDHVYFTREAASGGAGVGGGGCGCN